MAQISSNTPFNIDLGLTGSHVLVTGGCGLIGKVVAHAFLAAGAHVSVVDLTPPEQYPVHQQDENVAYFQGDITKDIDDVFQRAESRFGAVECCIALAGLDLSVLKQSESLCDMDPSTWQRVFDVNINGTFLTCQRWLKGIRSATQDSSKASRLRNVGLVIAGSESGRFGVRTMAAYAAGKSAVQYGLLQSLAQDAPRIYGKARVNAVAPGAVDTDRFNDECERYGEGWRWEECEATVGLAKPVPPEDVARTILFLASEQYSGSIHGQLLHVDAGKTGTMIWTREELAARRQQ